jgi:hypothetical protein
MMGINHYCNIVWNININNAYDNRTIQSRLQNIYYIILKKVTSTGDQKSLINLAGCVSFQLIT